MTPHRFAPPGLRTVRLHSGLILFGYVTEHLLNHALGNVSLDWMQQGLVVHVAIWNSAIGTVALYGALTTHFVLGLWALYERRRLHWSAAELAQLLLGLAVPPLLANHVAGTRLAFATFDVSKGYPQLLYKLWIDAPLLGWLQLALLVVAWTHGCLGVFFWLRLKPWFGRARSALFAAAILVPVLALLGYFQAGREVVALARDPAWREAALQARFVGTASQNAWLNDVRDSFLLADAVAIAVILLARLARVCCPRAC